MGGGWGIGLRRCVAGRGRREDKILWRGSLLPLDVVGAVECNEAAIFPQALESQTKDQKIAAFGSSYTQPSGSKLPRHKSGQLRRCVNGSSVLLSTWFSTKLERTLVTPSIRVRCPSSSFW